MSTEEKEAEARRNEGYRAVTHMMIDENIAFMSCSSVYRILKDAGLMRIMEQRR